MSEGIGDRLRVGGVLAPNVRLVWAAAWPLLARAAQEGETEAEVRRLVATGQAQLWGAWSYGTAASTMEPAAPELLGAVLTQVSADWPCVTIPLLGGRDLQRWVNPLWTLIRAWAQAQGCRCIVIAGRPGWRRVLGFRLAGRTASNRDLMVYPLEG